MSMNASINQAIAHLKTQLGIDDSEIGEAVDGKPPPGMGQRYVTVDEGEWTNDSDLSLDERLGLEITITLRTGVYPTDRVATPKAEIRDWARKIRVAVHMNYTLMNLINTEIDTETSVAENGLIEPFKFISGGRTMMRGPDWFWAEGGDDAITGISRTLVFGKALRIQTLESME